MSSSFQSCPMQQQASPPNPRGATQRNPKPNPTPPLGATLPRRPPPTLVPSPTLSPHPALVASVPSHRV